MVAFALVGVAVVALVVPWTHAQAGSDAVDRRELAARQAAERRRESESRQLADAIVEQRQALTGRPFAPGYRETLMRPLVGLPLETLREIQEHGAQGDLRTTIEAALRPDARSESADDLLPLPVRLTEPSAVSGVAQSGSVFVPVPPCRILDTRFAAAGPLVPGAARSFVVTGSDAALFTAQGGSATGCGIPTGTSVAAFLNFVAVGSTGLGHLRGWAYAASLPPAPFAAMLNYSSTSGAIANGVTVPLCDPLATTCTYDVLAEAFGSSTHVVADVLGYFRTPPTSFATIGRSFTTAVVGSACTPHPGAVVFVDAPAPGRVLVQSSVQLRFDHTVSVLDQIFVGIGQSPTDCGTADGIMTRVFAEPSGFYFPTVTPSRLFTITTPGSYVFYVTGSATGSLNDQFWSARIQATYHPD
jgi:hypothetical protein